MQIPLKRAPTTGTAERDAAMAMLQQIPGSGQVTVGGDKGFVTAEFVREC